MLRFFGRNLLIGIVSSLVIGALIGCSPIGTIREDHTKNVSNSPAATPTFNPASLTVIPQKLVFSNAALTPSYQGVVTITNTGTDGTWDASLSQSAESFVATAITPQRGEWKHGDTTQLMISIPSGEAIESNQTGTITITTKDIAGNVSMPQTVSLTQVAVRVALQSNTNTVSLHATAANPKPSITIQLTNTGVDAEGWNCQIQSPTFALTASPNGAALFDGTNIAVVTLHSDFTGLPQGDFTGTVSCSASYRGNVSNPISITVHATVS